MTPIKHRSYFCDFDKELQMHTYKLCIQLCTTIYKTYGVPQTTYYIQCDILLCTIYLLCIPYHKHYMQHTTHFFLYIIDIKYQQDIDYILYIMYRILCTRYQTTETRYQIPCIICYIVDIIYCIICTTHYILYIMYYVYSVQDTRYQILSTRY